MTVSLDKGCEVGTNDNVKKSLMDLLIYIHIAHRVGFFSDTIFYTSNHFCPDAVITLYILIPQVIFIHLLCLLRTMKDPNNA